MAWFLEDFRTPDFPVLHEFTLSEGTPIYLPVLRPLPKHDKVVNEEFQIMLAAVIIMRACSVWLF